MKTGALQCVALAALQLQAGLAAAQGCKPGQKLIYESATAWHCLELTLPKIDPRFFVTEAEVQFARDQIALLNVKKRRYQGQLGALDRMRGGLTLAARDLSALRREIMLDNVAHALNVLSWAVGDAVPEPSKTLLLQQITVLKGEVNVMAASEAQPVSDRQLQKGIDAAFNIKNLILDIGTKLPPQQLVALQRASDTLPAMVRISERFARSNPDASALVQAADTLDDLVAGTGALLPMLQAARSAVHVAGGEVALWHIGRSKGHLDEAFVRSQTARRYYLERIAEVDELQSFYRERLQRAGMK